MKVIGLGGRKRSGKDVVADRLVDAHGYVKIGMSDPIDEATRDVNPLIPARKRLFRSPSPIRGAVPERGIVGVPYSEYVDDVCGGDFALAKENHEVRRILQMVGDLGRSIDIEVWTKRIAQRIERLVLDRENVVLTGVRFPLEIDVVRSFEGSLWWISRPGHEDISDRHSTETSVSEGDFDTILVNDSTISYLNILTDNHEHAV